MIANMTVMVSEGLMTLLTWTFPLKIHKQKQETCYLVICKKTKNKTQMCCIFIVVVNSQNMNK